MPPLHHLNPPPHPFWDFVQGLDDHPFFAAYAPRNPNTPPGQPDQSENTEPQQTASENARGKQPASDDPPEVDPSTLHNHGPQDLPFRGRGRHHGRPEGCEGRRGPGCHGRGGFRSRGGPFGGHVPPFVAGPGSFSTGPGPFWTGPRHHSHHPHRGSPREHDRGHRGPAETGPGFNLGEFLNNLGDRLGIDLAGAAENLGLDKFSAPKSEDADFEPRTDIFDTKTNYIIHLSLPGAKKQDVGVDWDGEHSILRITGVVHRPDVDEQLLSQLVVNGRKRENGVFEKAIRLGTKREPASVDVAGITAKMTDGVLVVKVPKVDREIHRREVPISGSASPNRAQNEKDLLFDADEEMYDAAPTAAKTDDEVVVDEEKSTPAAPKSKAEDVREDRSVTAGREDEALPRYEEPANNENMSDWEKDSDEEADYVKINVD